MNNVTRLLLAIAPGLAASIAFALRVSADPRPLDFPQGYADGVRYATVERGNIREEIFTSRAAIDAVKAGQPIPPGTIIMLVDYRDGRLFRYVAMEKRPDGWRYQPYRADKSANIDDDPSRCAACHQSQAHQDFVWTIDRMRRAN